jgi:CheY-like chemotaxis protein
MIQERPNILIVEDEQDIATQLQEELEREGFRVHVAGSGIEAIASLEKHGPPSLILLDLLLPEMDGWQFLKAQSARKEWHNVPVVAISAVSYRGAPGAAAVLPKPINLAALIQIIHQVRSKPARATG